MNRRSFLKLLGGAVALLKFNPSALVEAASPRKAIRPRLFWAPPGYEGAARELIESEWGKHTHGITAEPGDRLTIESDSHFQSPGEGGMMQSSEGWRAVWVKDIECPGLYRYGATVRWVIPPAKPWSAKLVDGDGIPRAVLTQIQGKASGVISCLSTNEDLHLEVNTH